MQLNELLKVPMDSRDSKWESQFLKSLSESNIKLISEAPQTGPDGWPYLLAETDTTDATEPAQKVLQWLASKGIGLVINPTKEYPDYVLSYGMIWSFRETGYFFRQNNQASGQVEFDPSQIVHGGAPTEQYLPTYVRQIIKEFFRDQGFFNLKILLISTDKLNYDLVISLDSLGNPPPQEHQGIAEAISWFLPPHYSILLMSEKGLPAFVDL